MKERRTGQGAISWKWLIILTVISIYFSPMCFAGRSGGKFTFRLGPRVKVMTQNLYVGADISRVLDPAVLTSGNPLALFETTAQIYATTEQTNFHERARIIAEQIAQQRPHLIGLQEVYTVRRQSPSDFFIGNPSQEYQFESDYLAILLEELKALDLDYAVVAAVQEADVELPILVGFDETRPLFDDVRITDRDVILARFDVRIADVTARNYTDNFVVPLGNVAIEFTRGFCKVTAEINGQKICFVNTHLEVRGPSSDGIAIQRLQAYELMDVLAEESLPTILVGDFNSDPSDDPETYAYSVMAASGFIDAWTRRWWHTDPGFTCCQNEDLLNEESLLYERIDLIFVRNDMCKLPFSLIGPVFIQLLGDKPDDKTESGLWPSDHAGVAATFRIPRVRYRR